MMEPTANPVLNPTVLAYIMAPLALLVILLLMRAGVVAEPVWLWVLVFVAVLGSSRLLDHLSTAHPSAGLLQVRVAAAAAGVTTVIYLTGWGPVLLEAYAFLALENVAYGGSRVWRITAFWSLLGIIAGQVAIWQGWVPSGSPSTRPTPWPSWGHSSCSSSSAWPGRPWSRRRTPSPPCV